MGDIKVLGPIMVPNLKLLRYHEKIGAYHLIFSKKDIAF